MPKNKISNPEKSVNVESQHARTVRGAVHPLYDLNNPVLVVSQNYGGDELTRSGAERVDWITF